MTATSFADPGGEPVIRVTFTPRSAPRWVLEHTRRSSRPGYVSTTLRRVSDETIVFALETPAAKAPTPGSPVFRRLSPRPSYADTTIVEITVEDQPPLFGREEA